MDQKLAILFALLNAILWGIAPVLFKKSYIKLSPIISYIIDGLLGGTIIMLPYVIITNRVDFSNLFSSILLTLVYSLTYIMFLYAFNFGKAGIVSVIIEINPVFTLIFGQLFFQQYLEGFKILIIIGILILSLNLGAITEQVEFTNFKSYLTKKWFLFSILTAVLIGIGDNLLNKSVDLFNNYTTTLAIYLSQIFIILFLFLIKRNYVLNQVSKTFKNKKLLPTIILASLFMNIGAVVFYVAFEKGSAPMVSAVSGTSPIFTILLSYIIFKEKIKYNQLILIFLILVLIWMLG